MRVLWLLLLVVVCVVALPTSTANAEQCSISDMKHGRNNAEINLISVNEGLSGNDKSRVKLLTVAELKAIAANPPSQDVLIDFDAYWCKKSQEFVPVYDEVADRLVLRPDVTVVRVQLDGDEEIVKDLDIKGFPTITMWKKGSNLMTDMLRFHGTRSRVNVLSWIENNSPNRRVPPQESVAFANYACLVGDPKSHDLTSSELEQMCATVLPEPSENNLEPSEKLAEQSVALLEVGGAGDNSPPRVVSYGVGNVTQVNDTNYMVHLGQGKYTALYFHSPSCDVCYCLEPVWWSVSWHLVNEGRVRDLLVGSVNGDDSPNLVANFNITKYPSYVVINKQATVVLGTYEGPSKVFDLSTWVQDLLLGDRLPIVKHQFTKGVEEDDDYSDLGPLYPYSGGNSFPDSAYPQNIHTPSASSSITPSPSPSASLPCHEDDDDMLFNVFQSRCEDQAGENCAKPNALGNTIRSLCPVTCASCVVAQEDNNVAVSSVFTSSCAAHNISSASCNCTTARLAMNWCDPTELSNPYSRYLNSLCPVTCRPWVVAGGDPGVGNVDSASKVNLLQSGMCEMADVEASKAPTTRHTTLGASHLQHSKNLNTPFYPSEFSPGIEAKSPTFVMFHHPSCTYCQSSYPLWDAVIADAPTQISPDIDIGYMSCSAHWNTCEKFGVKFLPTMAFMESGKPMELTDTNTFTGDRNVLVLEEWVRAMTSTDQSAPQVASEDPVMVIADLATISAM